MPLAITNTESIIRLESRHLTVADNDRIAGIVPLNLLKRVILTDIPQISGAVIQALLQRHIPVIMLTGNGEYLGQTHYSPSGYNERKRLQYSFEQGNNLLPAKRLLETKHYNQKRVLQRLASARNGKCYACINIKKFQGLLYCKTSLNELCGIEGLAAREYFGALRAFIPDWCNFTGRHRRPAPDPFNAALSYSYAVMTGELENLLRLHLLEPGIGFLHKDQYNVPTLALDLQEIFRPCFCDMLIISLFNHHQLRKEHFEFDSENGACRLNRNGKNVFFTAWERKRKCRFKYGDKRMQWQDIWNQQILNWIKFLEKQTDINFFKMK